MSRLLDFLSGRSLRYKRTFDIHDTDNRVVLRDLMKFGRVNTTCFDPDPRIHALLEGRREVVQRILNHLNLPPSELLRVYNPGQETQE